MSCCKADTTKKPDESKKAAAANKKNDDRTAAERKAAWEKIKAKLPRGKNDQEKEKRKALFEQFDKDKSGSLTEAEVYKGCVEILGLDAFAKERVLKDIVKKAFKKAKDMGNKEEGKGAADKVEFLEFRLMLCYIYDNFALRVMFDEIDDNGNGMLNKEEFKNAIPKIEQWGLKITDVDAAFKEMDDSGNGLVSFTEFAAWATPKKLDVDGDPDA